MTSRPILMDPLLDCLRLLRPRAALFGGGFDAFGRWQLAFQKRHDLLFCWLETGECQLIRSGHDPVHLKTGDFALIYTSTSFILASDTSIEPVDSEVAVATSKRLRLTLGSGAERPVTVHAGKFVLEKANQDLLERLLPSVIRLASDDESLGRVRSLLAINQAEARQPGPASEFVSVRLIELMLLEILRHHQSRIGEEFSGLLAGLADRVTGQALTAMHLQVAHGWSVGELARLCGVSRSNFSRQFRSVVGIAPIEYLLHWRMALAKEELRLGKKRVAEIAFTIGFQSSSAFTTAFKRVVGCSPTRFARKFI
jgi:AraC-like DNA-binding protein